MGPSLGHPLVGIVPAAGYGTRLLPLRGSKEVYPVGGRPVMDYVVARMRRTGCRDIRVVTRPEKGDVIEHATRSALRIVRGRPASVSESILAGLEETDEEGLVLIGFPDTVWDPADGFVRALAALGAFDVALGLFAEADPRYADVVEVTDRGLVTNVRVKPLGVTQPTWIWGFAVARASALHALEDDPEPGRVFDSMSRRGRVVGIKLPGSYVDIGRPQTLSSVRSGPPPTL
jgi:glucose-1-phosphate thymidylyltransferase